MAKGKPKLKLWYVQVDCDWGDSYEVEAKTRLEAENKALDLARATILVELIKQSVQFEVTADIEEVLE